MTGMSRSCLFSALGSSRSSAKDSNVKVCVNDFATFQLGVDDAKDARVSSEPTDKGGRIGRPRTTEQSSQSTGPA
jgi:hypothetical protein